MTGSKSFLLFLVFLLEIVLYGAGTEKVPQPYFEAVGSGNTTVYTGQDAFLHCRVRGVGDREVVWIRKRDLHVLTFNVITFTTDQRFSVFHPENSDDYTLQIKSVQKRDAGIYECQVNTEPKIYMSTTLHVADRDMNSVQGIHSDSTQTSKEAQASITGPEYVRTSSTISLTCTVSVYSQPAGSISWFHGKNLVDFNSPRGGISMETTKTDTGTTSKLIITKASTADAGNYTCVPTNAGPAFVNVHVVNEEHSEPIHHVGQGIASPHRTFSISLAVSSVLTHLVLFLLC